MSQLKGPNVTSPIPPNCTAADMDIAAARLESIKAGLLGALAVGLVEMALIGVSLLPHASAITFPLALPHSLWAYLVNLAVALCSGFFFGVTYRYIVRQDDNLHLGSGAVGAFALTRSLAQIEAAWNDSFAFLPWLLITGESFLWFAAARYTLDWAIGRKLVKSLD